MEEMDLNVLTQCEYSRMINNEYNEQIDARISGWINLKILLNEEKQTEKLCV